MDLKGYTVEELAAFANVSVDVIKSAIKLRQQQMMKEKIKRTSPTKSVINKVKSISSSPSTKFPPSINYNSIQIPSHSKMVYKVSFIFLK